MGLKLCIELFGASLVKNQYFKNVILSFYISSFFRYFRSKGTYVGDVIK